MAWTVVAASFMISLIQEGTIYSFGILVPRISDRFGVGRAEASLASSIFIFLTFASGPAVAALIIRWLTLQMKGTMGNMDIIAHIDLCYSRWGHRPVTILGAVLSAAGLLGAAVYIHLSLAPSILVLYVCVGLVTGLGFGLMYLPAWDIIEVEAVNEISQ